MGIRDFEHDPDVTMFMDAINAMNIYREHRRLVPAEQAQHHMDETLRGDEYRHRRFPTQPGQPGGGPPTGPGTPGEGPHGPGGPRRGM